MALESFGFGQDVLKTIAVLVQTFQSLDQYGVILCLTTSTFFPPKAQSHWRLAAFSLRDEVERRHLMSVKHVSTKINRQQMRVLAP